MAIECKDCNKRMICDYDDVECPKTSKYNLLGILFKKIGDTWVNHGGNDEFLEELNNLENEYLEKFKLIK